MRKKLLVFILTATMALPFTACGSETAEPAKEETSSEENAKPEKPVEKVTYQSILDEYTQKITEAVPGLVEEYNVEAVEKVGDVNALAELSNSKVTALAEISNEGITEMATLMQTSGDEYAIYEEWAGKLTNVYTEQSQQITDAYMSSATQ